MSHQTFARAMGWAATLLVGTAVVLAFWIVGSPVFARKQKTDSQRTQDLASVAGSVRSYYREHKVLPTGLSAVRPSESVSSEQLADPLTRQPYEYKILAADRFALCAIFETNTMKLDERSMDYYQAREFYRHPAGHYCFTLPAIDPYGG